MAVISALQNFLKILSNYSKYLQYWKPIGQEMSYLADINLFGAMFFIEVLIIVKYLRLLLLVNCNDKFKVIKTVVKTR
jgi:hypothetical protein